MSPQVGREQRRKTSKKKFCLSRERYLRTLPNLQRMTSWADTGSAWVELEFPQSTEISDALIRVSNALSQVSSYPENVDQPRLYSSSYSDNAFMYFRLVPVAGNPLNLDIDMMRDFANDFIHKWSASKAFLRHHSRRRRTANPNTARSRQTRPTRHQHYGCAPSH